MANDLSKTSYRGNENLKEANAIEYVDKNTYRERILELVRCKEDIVYFAEKYFYIVTLDEGKKIIKLYPKQNELVRFLQNNKRCVVLASRQSSKCCTGETTINIRNKKTGEIKSITFEEFEKMIKGDTTN